MTEQSERHVPAAGRRGLETLYDPVMALTVRERAFRAAITDVALTASAAGPILDLGCGTGSQLLQLARLAPGRELIGIDVDTAILERARGKLTAAGVSANLLHGSADALPLAVCRRVGRGRCPGGGHGLCQDDRRARPAGRDRPQRERRRAGSGVRDRLTPGRRGGVGRGASSCVSCVFSVRSRVFSFNSLRSGPARLQTCAQSPRPDHLCRPDVDVSRALFSLRGARRHNSAALRSNGERD